MDTLRSIIEDIRLIEAIQHPMLLFIRDHGYFHKPDIRVSDDLLQDMFQSVEQKRNFLIVAEQLGLIVDIYRVMVTCSVGNGSKGKATEIYQEMYPDVELFYIGEDIYSLL